MVLVLSPTASWFVQIRGRKIREVVAFYSSNTATVLVDTELRLPIAVSPGDHQGDLWLRSERIGGQTSKSLESSLEMSTEDFQRST